MPYVFSMSFVPAMKPPQKPCAAAVPGLIVIYRNDGRDFGFTGSQLHKVNALLLTCPANSNIHSPRIPEHGIEAVRVK